MNAVDIRNINKNYNNFSLDNISIEIPVGMITGLIGENGAGKTTLIKSILGLSLLNSGEIKILGEDLNNIKDRIGVVFDDIYFNPTFTPSILEKIMRNSYDNWNRELYFKYLDDFGLPENQKVSTFSKGMKVKLQIALALAHNPDLLILDEITSGLDPIFRDSILDLLLEFIQDENHSILISSHNLEDLERIADKIVLIDNGSLILDEYIDDLRDNYKIFRGDKAEINHIEGDVISILEKDYSNEVLIKTRSKDQNLETARLDDIFKLLIKGKKP